MNPQDIKKITELIQTLKQLDQISKLSLLLEQLREVKEITDEHERERWLEEREELFQGLKPEDWAWLKEKANYDEGEWKKIMKELA